VRESSVDQIRKQLDEVEDALARTPECGTVVAARVFDIMRGATAIDTSRSSFALGQVFEALRPMREREALLIKKARALKDLTEADLAQADRHQRTEGSDGTS